MDKLQNALKLVALLGVQNALVVFGPALINLIQGVVGTTTTTYSGNITSGFGQLPVLASVLYV